MKVGNSLMVQLLLSGPWGLSSCPCFAREELQEAGSEHGQNSWPKLVKVVFHTREHHADLKLRWPRRLIAAGARLNMVSPIELLITCLSWLLGFSFGFLTFWSYSITVIMIIIIIYQLLNCYNLNPLVLTFWSFSPFHQVRQWVWVSSCSCQLRLNRVNVPQLLFVIFPCVS